MRSPTLSVPSAVEIGPILKSWHFKPEQTIGIEPVGVNPVSQLKLETRPGGPVFSSPNKWLLERLDSQSSYPRLSLPLHRPARPFHLLPHPARSLFPRDIIHIVEGVEPRYASYLVLFRPFRFRSTLNVVCIIRLLLIFPFRTLDIVRVIRLSLIFVITNRWWLGRGVVKSRSSFPNIKRGPLGLVALDQKFADGRWWCRQRFVQEVRR